MPAVNHHQIICRSTANIRILESLIPNDVMEMLHAGDTKGALQALGVRDETPTSIIESLTKTLRRELEQQQLRLEFYKSQDYSSEAAKQKSIESQQQKIQSLVSRIDTIEERMQNFASTNCPICYSDVETPSMTPCCKNLFCFVCLCESLKRQSVCPLCRTGIASVNEIHVINNEASTPAQTIDQPRTKIEEFINFAEKNPNSKILLFSGYDATFFQLTAEMEHRNISFSAINGSTARVQKIINEFKTGTYRVLLLNSRHVGSGLNIVSATDVFLFHKMNSEMEKQIVGRAYRMGRTAPLNVYHLLHNNEI
jgi:SNF2 family DNA or RNA helicase